MLNTEPAPSTYLYTIEDEGILYCDATKRIYNLNTTATFVWICLEQSMPNSKIVEALAGTFRLPKSQARGHVSTIITQWRNLGLLSGELPLTAVAAKPERDQPESQLRAPPYREPHVADLHTYTLLDTTMLVRYTSPEQRVWVHPVLSHLENVPCTDVTFTLDIIRSHDDGIYLYMDARPIFAAGHERELAPVVKNILWEKAVNNSEFFLDIHAGVVFDGGSCVLLPGAPGSGKSILTAALSKSGFQYFSDEVALLEDRTLEVAPVPLSICIKSSGIPALANLFPEILEAREHERVDGKRVRYLAPPACQRPQHAKSFPVSRIVFPTYSVDGTTSISTLSKTQALGRLFNECVVIKREFTTDRVTRLLKWIDDVLCSELIFSDVNEAVKMIRDQVP